MLENPRLHAASPGEGMALLEMIIQRSISIPFERVGVSAPACQLDLGRDDLQFKFVDMAGEFLADPSAPTLKLAYGVPGSGKGSRCEVMLTRDRRTEPFETSLLFKTVEGSPLPARMLNVLFDAEDWLGAEAKVSGMLDLRQAGSNDWRATFQGEMLDVDLARLVNRRFPRHRLTGRARIAVENAAWGQRPAGQGPGWVLVKGQLSAGQGSIGLDLFEALAREMKFRLGGTQTTRRRSQARGGIPLARVTFAMQSNGEIQIERRLGHQFPPDAFRQLEHDPAPHPRAWRTCTA